MSDNVEVRLLHIRQTSKRLISSLVAAAGGVLYKVTGYKHAFSIDDPAISYPLAADTVSITIVGIVACGIPAVVILVLALLIPSSSIEASGKLGTEGTWNRRLWEWHAGWLGLGLSLSGAFFITSGLKDVVGKPRPDLLARCDPDLSNLAAHLVGGLGLKETSAPILVDTSICQNPDSSVIKNGFAAFPSGHSSFSWAGLLYLSLWLSVKFAITFPVPFPMPSRTGQGAAQAGLVHNANETGSFRSSAAAPPLYLLLLVISPVAAALYICATRYADYMHAGWDILGGSLIGMVFAYMGFRWYHIPFGDGGWAWAPRSAQGAFGLAFGSSNFAGNEGQTRDVRRNTNGYEDLELGPVR
ncbi:PAP2 superfamily-domain-containing protein [Penicillium cinerascens]|uniref:PAP2 superfamily-domain-containing protein n=1 Tax=Penicillium cinerascens TaxID=70096 RepID=A0A9W9JLT6_9EURO|nr:PAP2 superfamily-domain-containing protein [Penicillium cinerascens]KAJ5198782.1 PAP2 superfamily-domain-containing protein [Penicillium cinerascens]